jgi:hypothetical protein
MAAGTRIPQISASLPARWQAPAGARPAPPLEPEHVEEVWDAELVYDELPARPFVSGSALSAYGWAGTSVPASLVDLRA